MSARTQTPPNLLSQPNIGFRNTDFDATIWNKGYDITLETAIECPCAAITNSALPSCINCHGLGWVYINPIKTKGVIHSINRDTKLKDWTIENIGTASLTVLAKERISFMDRVTVLEEYSYLSELKTVYLNDNDPFCFLSYEAVEIQDVFLFVNSETELIRLNEDQYNISTNGYCLEFQFDFSGIENFNGKVSVRYKHKTQYHILDIPHNIRSSKVMNNDGTTSRIEMPLNAIIRKAHYVQTKPDFRGEIVDLSNK